jgi:hypothetical protein
MLEVGLMRCLKTQTADEAVERFVLRRLHDFLERDQVRIELAQFAVDDLRSSRIAFRVPDIERRDPYAHGALPSDLEISSRLTAAALKIDEPGRACQVHLPIWQLGERAAP